MTEVERYAYYTDGVGAAEVPNVAKNRQAFERLGWVRVGRAEYLRIMRELRKADEQAAGGQP